MLRRKKIAKLKRQKIQESFEKESLLIKKFEAKKKKEQYKLKKEIYKWKKEEFLKKYKENFGNFKEYKTRKTWAEGPTTKSRSVLNNY